MILAPAEKQSYLLKVWLQETGTPQNEDQGLSSRNEDASRYLRKTRTNK